jgi:hypothetical protein
MNEHSDIICVTSYKDLDKLHQAGNTLIIIVCLIKTSSGSQKTELHDVKCYKVINSKKILYYNAI